MQNFFDLKRRAARALRPLARRLGQGGELLAPPEAVFDAFERLYAQVEDVRQILLDGDRTSARLVVNPARVVVDETRRSFAYLCLYGVATDAVIANRILPEEAAGGAFAAWREREREQLAEIERSFPVPRLRARLRASEPIGVESLRDLAREVYGERDPAQLFATGRPIRLSREGARTRLSIDLPGLSADEVDVCVRGDELLIGARDAQRRVTLPASVAGAPVASVRLSGGVLEIAFGP
jgi:arsenite-transporting ATPase